MTRPRLLDLFCGAGGAAMGYHRAGFEVVGVDINPQPHYPFEFWKADALDVLRAMAESSVFSEAWNFDAIHASPPCQAYSMTARLHNRDHPRLIEPTREALVATGKPYVIENVVGAPLHDPVRLCGSSFGLPIRRHRLFEMVPAVPLFPPCVHHLNPNPVDVTGGGPDFARMARRGVANRKPLNVAHAGAALGIEWMTRRELNEAIPPAYTEWIGRQLIAALAVAA